MRNQAPNQEYISMKSLVGDAKMCTKSTPEFRDECIFLARSQGIKLQDLVLVALRDKVLGNRKGRQTLEGRRALALERLFANKRTPQEIKDAVDSILKRHLPQA
jgi:hypothetical protein